MPPPSVDSAPGPPNRHQLKLNRAPVPDPVNFKKRSCVPVVLVMVQDLVTHVCAPPVPATAQVPITVPVRLSICNSMLPPLVLEATRASNDVAPVPKATVPALGAPFVDLLADSLAA